MSKFPSVLVIAVALCFSCIYAVEDRPEGTQECLAKSGALEADVFARPRKFSKEINCFWKCILEKSTVLDAAGVLNVDLFEKGFPKAAASLQPQQITDLKKCLGTVGKIAICDDMSKIRDCFVKISGLKADDKPEHTAECIAKSGATEADVFARPRKESPEIRCFWKCIMEKDGMLDASGVLNPDMFETSFPKAAAKLDAQSITDLKKCLGAVGKITTCEDTTKIRDCIVKAFKQ